MTLRRNILFISVYGALCPPHLAASEQPTLNSNFREAQAVVIATSQAVPRVSNTPVPKTTRRGLPPGLRVFPCEFRLRVHYAIKGTILHPEDLVSVLMYSPLADCSLNSVRGSGNPLTLSVWFLRKEGEHYRTVVDTLTSLIAIRDLSNETLQVMENFSGAAQRLGYLLLTPGVMFDVSSFADSTLGLNHELLELCGMEDFLRIVREHYIRGTPEFQDQLSLILSRYAMCVGGAEKLALKMPLSIRNVRYPYWSREKVSVYERAEMSTLEGVINLKQLRRRFSPMTDLQIRESLIWNACSSAKNLKSKARFLLNTAFHITSNDLPCAPCE